MKFLTQSVLALSLLAGAAVPSFAEDATANGTMDASKCTTTEQGTAASTDANCLNAQDKKSGNPGGDSSSNAGNTNGASTSDPGTNNSNGNSTGNAGDNNSGTGTGNGTGSGGGSSSTN